MLGLHMGNVVMLQVAGRLTDNISKPCTVFLKRRKSNNFKLMYNDQTITTYKRTFTDWCIYSFKVQTAFCI